MSAIMTVIDPALQESTSETFNKALGTGRGAADNAPAIPAAATPADERRIPEGIECIRDAEQLAALADRLGLRRDWHEPDEQEVSARLVGTHLDNAMGPGFIRGKSDTELEDPMTEFYAIIEHDGEQVAAVSICSLLAWASEAHRQGR